MTKAVISLAISKPSEEWTERRNLIKNDIVTLSSFGVSRSVSKCELRECGVLHVTLRYNSDKSESLRVTTEDKDDV